MNNIKKNLRISLCILALFVFGNIVQWAGSLEYPINYAAQSEYWDQQRTDAYEHIQAWNEQKIVKYQMTIRYPYQNPSCQREMIVEHNSVDILKDDCPKYKDADTVDYLFASILAVASVAHCGPNGCECDGPDTLDIVYDKQYKFPKKASSALHPEESWRYKKNKVFPFIEEIMFARTFCTILGVPSTGWAIDSFTPLE